MPETRATQADDFLRAAGWGNATRRTIAGDASNRRYDRLTAADGTVAVLMDAPPSKGEDVRPFVNITIILRALNLSAPAIYAEDPRHGFLLLEDLGDDLFAKVVLAKPETEEALYTAAVDVLIALHKAPAPHLPAYDSTTTTPLAALAFDWYQRGATGSVDAAAKAHFETVCTAALQPLDPELSVLIQRDYHAENLIWLPDRTGVARVGLLDYQDAMLGHPAYDLVSILQDARRDVDPALAQRMVDHYVTTTGTDATVFARAYALMGMQRNLRIIGVFARLSMSYGKPHYVDLIPRVWAHLNTCLQHPACADIADALNGQLPAPTDSILQSLKDQCATIPRP